LPWQKWELFLVEPQVKSQYWWDILLSQQMLAVIKRFVDNNIIIICFSATQLMHAQHSSIAAAQNSAFHFS